MELVDANTKNFLFLTLSQFNDQDKLVRARVSMRRDQPFWEGGNSFIACESFRISSSPNKGGLYYKQIPYDWYLGSNQVQTGPAAPSVYKALEVPAIHSNLVPLATNPQNSNKHLTANNIRFRDNNSAIDCELYLKSKVLLTATVQRLPTSNPDVIVPILKEFLNEHQLGSKTWTKFIKGVDPSISIETTAVSSPSLQIEGPGFGPTGMYFPRCQWDDAAGFAAVVVDPNTIATHRTFTTTLTVLAAAWQDAAFLPMSSAQQHIIKSALGKGIWTECQKSDSAVNADWVPFFQGGCVEFIAPNPATVTTDLPNNCFAGGDRAKPLHPIRWEGVLAAGTPVSMLIPDIVPGTTQPDPNAGTYHGKCLVAGGWDDPAADGFQISGVWRFNEEAYNWALAHLGGGTSHDKVHAMLSVPTFIKLGGWYTDVGPANGPHNLRHSSPISEQIISKASFNVKAHVNNVVNGAEVPGAYLTIQSSGPVAIAKTAAALQNIRHLADGDEPRYIYTPNEMFYAFNQPVAGVKPPWTLQTDDNGGFVIDWDEGAHKSDFVISVPIVEAMGLNPYMDYEQKVDDSDIPIVLAMIKDPQFDPWIENIDKEFKFMKPGSLSTTLSVPRGPWTPVNINTIAINTPVYDARGQKFLFTGHVTVPAETSVTRVQRLLPKVEIDENGINYYHYTNCPSTGRIGNTQQVSVESFGTFSAINIVIPNLPFQPMLGTSSDERILASLRIPFEYGTTNDKSGAVTSTNFSYYGDLLFNSDSSRSYLKITTDQQLYDCDVEIRLIARDGTMEIMQLPYLGQFQIKLRFLQTQ